MAQLDELISEAIEAVGKDLSPKAKEAYANSMRHYVEQGGSIAEAFGLTKENLEWIYARAYGLYKAGKYNDAMVLFKFLIRLDETTFKYYLGLGACYFMQEQYETALYPYIIATYYEKTNPIPYYYMSECFLKMGNKKAALRTYEKMLAFLDTSPFFPHLKERIKMSAESLRKELGTTPTPAPVSQEKS